MLLWSLVANAMMYPNAEERATAHVRFWQILLQKSKIERPGKSCES
jgi:hypothetical protein